MKINTMQLGNLNKFFIYGQALEWPKCLYERIMRLKLITSNLMKNMIDVLVPYMYQHQNYTMQWIAQSFMKMYSLLTNIFITHFKTNSILYNI